MIKELIKISNPNITHKIYVISTYQVLMTGHQQNSKSISTNTLIKVK